MFSGRVDTNISPDRVDAAGRLWAAATAARGGDPDPAPLGQARSKIADVLRRAPGAVLLTALDDADPPLGFAAVTPLTDTGAELCYLGVDPSAWGQGVGARLLQEVVVVMRSRGYTHIELWVYEDNPPAVALYERLGWRWSGLTRIHPASRRAERRYTLELT